MRRSHLLVVGALFSFGVVAACTVSFPVEDDKTFACNSNEDCSEGWVCEENENGNKVCHESKPPPKCKDEDGDGYGSELPINKCPACQNEQRNGCTEVDCDDTDESIHPGKFENCDGIDNDCDGDTDEPAGTGDEQCGAEPELRDCPLNSDLLSAEGAQFGCKEVGGTPQCLVTGKFSTSEACKNLSGQKIGTCENGSWTEVPCECRTGDSGCSN